MRSRTFQRGYELGRERNEQAQLRETKRVLELEVASFQNPQRVEVIAKTLLGMQSPTPDRIVPMRPIVEQEPVPAAPPPGAQAQR